mgnify:CR=1 FL=1
MGTTGWIGLALILVITCSAGAQGFRWQLEWQAGETGNRLSMVEVQDGLYETTEADGQPAVRPTLLFLYYNVEDSFLFKADLDCELVVEYLDEKPGEIAINYDALVDGYQHAFRSANTVQMKGTGQWEEAVFELAGAWFSNSENHGADLRVAFPEHKPPVRRVLVRVKGLAYRQFASEAEAQQARRQLKWGKALEGAGQALVVGEQFEKDLAILKAALPVNPAITELAEVGGDASRALRQATAEQALPESDEALGERIRELRAQQELLLRVSELAAAKAAQLAFLQAQYYETKPDWVAFTRPAIERDDYVLPTTLPRAAEVNAPLRLRVARGQVAPFTVAVLSPEDVDRVRARISGLHSAEGWSLDVSIDIRVVACWYQAGREDLVPSGKRLVPELLLHDDTAVRVDLIRGRNLLAVGSNAALRDAPELVPFALPALWTKQLWFTVKCGEKAKPGTYYGTVEFTARGHRTLSLPLTIEVLPFQLAENPLIASMYFSRPSYEGEDYEALLADLAAHGLTDPTYSLPTKGNEVDMEAARTELALRKAAGLNRGPLLTLGGYAAGSYLGDSAPEEEKRAKLKATIDAVNILAEEFGYDGAYLYGIDEASGEALRAEVPAFRVVQELGGHNWVAALGDFAGICLTELDLPNIQGYPTPEAIEAVHGAGHKIMRYAAPFGGPEDPWVWRNNYGLQLWEVGVDGGCTWAYRGAMGNCWDDFVSSEYRHAMMTYPGVGAPISTVQWEGYREGNTDLRYLATLLEALDNTTDKPELIAEFRQWLASNDGRPFAGDNLDTVRERIINALLWLEG